jgi:hypothetical protein
MSKEEIEKELKKVPIGGYGVIVFDNKRTIIEIRIATSQEINLCNE